MRKFFGFLLLVALLGSCAETVQEHLEEATKAMQKEDGRLALEHYQKAYLLALDKSFFPLGKDINFQNMAIDLTGEYIAVTSQEKKETLFWLLNTEGKVLKKNKIEANVQNLVFSPSGDYLVFSTQPYPKKNKEEEEENNTKTCDLFLFASQKKKIEKIPAQHHCQNLPAVSNAGVIQWIDSTVFKRYDSEQKKWLDTVNLKIKYAVKSIEPKASLFYTLSQDLFLTYGQAGIYNLYRIENNNTTLVSSKTAFWRLLLMPNSSKVVRVEGGAGKRHLLLFDGSGFYHSRNEKKIEISGASNFAFVNEDRFYFIEKKLVKENSENLSSALPFFASTIATDKYGQLYLLTTRHKFVKYINETPSNEALEIFKKVQEFYN